MHELVVWTQCTLKLTAYGLNSCGFLWARDYVITCWERYLPIVLLFSLWSYELWHQAQKQALHLAWQSQSRPFTSTLPRGTKRIEGPRANTKSGAHSIEYERRSGDTPSGDFTCSEVCSGGFWGSFPCIQYTHTCKSLSLFSSFRLKITTHRALASRLHSSYICALKHR